MARLILEEGATRRAFRVNEGKLTIGSGPDCTLRLASPDVAELHAELELRGGLASLRPRPGVMPPRMHGEPISQETPLPHDARFEIGGARFHFLQDDAAAGGAAPTRAVSPGGATTAASEARAERARAGRSAGARSSGARGLTGRAGADGSSRGVQRTRPRAQIKRGIPTWLLLVLIALALVVTFFALRTFLGEAGTAGAVPEATYQRALRHFEAREFESARGALANIDRTNISDDLRRQIEVLEEEMERIRAEVALDQIHRREAEVFRTTQLERFLKERLAGDNPPRERVRVFLKRLREFRTRWPAHPEMEWIDRHERIYSRFVDLSDPPTYADVAYEVETLTWAKPRSYDEAAALVRAFLEDATGSDREQALALLDQLAEEERAFFEDQMQQAKYHWERDQRPRSVGVLISLAVGLDDPEHVDAAAKELVNLPGIEDFLRTYQRTNPERYQKLVEVPRVRDVARRHGLIEG